MGRAAKAVIGGVCAAMFSVAGYGVYNIVGALSNGHQGSTATTGTGGTESAQPLTASDQKPSADQARQAAQAFLDAWAKGDTAAAAGQTDDPAAAEQGLSDYRDDLRLASLTLEPTDTPAPTPHDTPPPGAVPVGFHAGARLTGLGTWAYDGTVRVVRTTDGRTVVHWSPSVLHPRLTEETVLSAREVPPARPKVTDSAGRSIDAYPSLKALAPEFRKALDDQPGGTPGKGVVIAGAESGNALRTLHTFVKAKPGEPLKLTIDGRLQKAAEQAVAAQGQGGGRLASLVAVEPSTGRVLALANSQPGFNAAFKGMTAPGSTMKIITAAALLERGVAPGTPAPCAPQLYVYGKEFHNVEGSSNPGATLRDDFAASCNTGFINLRDKLGDGDLTAEARDVFGIGLSWHTGLANMDGSVPVPSGDEVEKAAAMIGQGRVQMNPLAMASVAATVRSGVFRQPILLPGLAQQPAARPLSSGVAEQLRGLMHTTAVSGTAAGVMSGLGGYPTGAKTGTAEVGSTTDSWFTAYQGDVAAAAMVQGGGHGSDAAGPAVRAVLAADR
ncbi:penicillin-binding transpeptidase domain-containing protein [Peterkaempfera bronchialis]|uniref:penicillin-binding transpeptidase domain-containing protein n=1 Tax=Peterkaempfera bronchialis TaxID=2126346 RepID=UPI003C2D5CA7